MAKDISVLFENDDYQLFSFEENKEVSYYTLYTYDNLFNAYRENDYNENIIKLYKKDIEDIKFIKVNYIKNIDGREVVIDSTNIHKLETKKYNRIIVNCIKSFDDVTSVSFNSREEYDKYIVYEVNENKYSVLLETDDFIIHTRKIKEGRTYFVEGYKKKDGKFVLEGTSKVFICIYQQLSFKEDEIGLSIVIPCYNSEKYLCRTVDSVLLSAIKNIEIILVDDGSKDKTGEIVDWYKNTYGKVFKVIHQENQGLSFARNNGLKIATGEYTAFLDSDDMVHPYMYDNLYKFAKKENLDMAICRVLSRDDVENTNNTLAVPNSDYLVYDFDKTFDMSYRRAYENILFVSAWCKIIRTDIVREHPFPPFNLYEDSAFTMMVYSYCDRIGYANNAVYIWDKRFQKTVGTYTNTYSKKGVDYLKAYYDAALYNVEKGNQDRLDYLTAYAIFTIYTHLFDGNNNLERQRDPDRKYLDYLKKFNSIYNVKENEPLKRVQEIYDFAIGQLETN